MKAITGLYALVDDDPRWSQDPVEQASHAIRGGASVIQLRAKHATDRQQIAWAEAIVELARPHRVPLFVNDRFDLALASGADGVHLGQTDLPPDRLPAEARRALRVGRSTHTLDQVRRARHEDVDYLAFGPVFGTTSKASEYSARGLGELARACEIARPLPMVAIGGIEIEHSAKVMRAGAAAICVISALAGASDPAAAAAALVRALEQARSPRG